MNFHFGSKSRRLAHLFLAAIAWVTANGLVQGAVQFQVLKSFEPEEDPTDSWGPLTGLINGTDGAFYGTTAGENFIDYIWGGTVFKVKPDGSGYTVLHLFEAGASLRGELLEASDGALYGTVFCLCDGSAGEVFKVNKDGSGFSVLHRVDKEFGYGESALVEGPDGALYGMTSGDGGSIFRLNRDGTGYMMLYQFIEQSDASAGLRSIILGRDGKLYGTTAGFDGRGSVFTVQLDGTQFQSLHDFGSEKEFGVPWAGLIEGKDGALYGTVSSHGLTRAAGIFKLQSDGTGYQLLHRLMTNSIPSQLTEGLDGALYGTMTVGSFERTNTGFRIQKDGSNYLELYSNFPPLEFSTGGRPAVSRLCQGRDGAFFGTTTTGGIYTNNWAVGGGTVFKLWPPETPKLTEQAGVSGQSRVTVKVDGVAGSQYRLFGSSDLGNWTLLSNLSMPREGFFLWEESTTPAAFFRAEWIPRKQ